MSVTILWAALGVALIGAAAVLIGRLPATALGPYSTRLIAIGAALAAYYGALSLAHRAPGLFHPVRLPALRYGVPIVAGSGALYCAVRVLQQWKSEVHGLLVGLLQLLALVGLAVLARLCLAH